MLTNISTCLRTDTFFIYNKKKTRKFISQDKIDILSFEFLLFEVDADLFICSFYGSKSHIIYNWKRIVSHEAFST